MEEQQRNIDELFREALAGYREQPPEEAWHPIARHLEEDRRRRGGFGRWMMLGLALLIAISGAGWWTMYRPAISSQPVANGNLQHPTDRTKTSPVSETLIPISSKNKVAKQERNSYQNHAIVPSILVQKITEIPAQHGGIPAQNTIATLNAKGSLPLTRNSMQLSPGIQAVTLSHSFQPAWLKAITHEKERVPELKGNSFRNLPATNPVTSLIPLALELPGYEPQLPQDERLRSEGLKRIEARPSRVFEASTNAARSVHPEAERLPDAEEVARTSSRGLPQVETDPLPLRKAQYAHSYSMTALASAGYSSALRGHYEAGIRAMIQLSEHLALGIQPGFSLNRLAEVKLTDAARYSREQLEVDSFRSTDRSPSVRNSIDTIYNYVVRQTLDSIVVAGLAAGGTFWEFNLPLIVRYSINEHWYAYGGPSINFAGKIKVHPTGGIQVFTSHRQDSLAQSEALPGSTFEHYFGKPSQPDYSSYKPVEVQNTPSVRVGYLLGLGYTKGKYSGAINLSQQFSGFSALPDAMQPAFAAPRVNLSFGYILFDSRKKVLPAFE
ncbi:MAG: hypothetical protein JST27_02250 [Bacteroidetes bacterium]|nr:hypothetical protein [Bacteroidota bacterium]